MKVFLLIAAVILLSGILVMLHLVFGLFRRGNTATLCPMPPDP